MVSLRFPSGWQHAGPVRALAPVRASAGVRLASAGDDGEVRLWDPGRPDADATVLFGHTAPVRALAAVGGAEGTRLASAGDDGDIRLWDVERPEAPVATLSGRHGRVTALAATSGPAGPRLASAGDDGVVRLWDPGDPGAEPTVVDTHHGPVRALVGVDTGDGPRLVAAGDKGVRWGDPTRPQVVTAELLAADRPVRALAVVDTTGGLRLATAGDDAVVRLLDPARPDAEPVALRAHRHAVLALARVGTADGARLASAGGDGAVRLWDPDAPDADPAILSGHEGAVAALAAVEGTDGPWLASAGADGRVGLAWLGARADGPEAAAAVVEQTPVVDDLPTDDDDLDRAPLALDLDLRLARYLVEQDSRAPLAVQVHGPWGAGKTSLANLLVTAREDRRAAEGGATAPPWLAIRYDAWRECNVGPVWWSLARTMRAGVGAARTPAFRPVFRVLDALSRARRTPAWLLVVGAAVGLVAVAAGTEAVGEARRWWPLVTAVVPVVLVADKFLFWDSAAGARLHVRADDNPLRDVAAHVSWLRRWSPRPALSGLQPRLARLTGAAVAAAAAWLALAGPATSTPAWAGLAAVAVAVAVWGGRLWWRWSAGGKRPILFVLDDLDRCGVDTAVEVLESVQTLMREDDRPRGRWREPAPLVFLALADARWLRTAFEERYASFAGSVTEPGHPLGYLFLDKLFQLTVAVPAVRPTQFARYVDSLLGVADHDGGRRDGGPSDGEAAGDERGEAMVEQVRAATSEAELYDPALADDWAQLAPGAQRRVQREEVAAAMAFEERTGGHLLAAYYELLPRNPRAVKRFINAYGINRTLTYTCLRVPRTDETSDRLARWTLLALRWPELGEALRRDPALLERAANGDGSQAGDGRVGSLLRDESVRRVIEHGDVPLRPADVARFVGVVEGSPSAPVGTDAAAP